MADTEAAREGEDRSVGPGKLSRRGFLATAAGGTASALAATTAGCTHQAKTNQPGEGPRWGMVIDLKRCFGCHACSVACKAEQDVPLGYFNSWVMVTEKGEFPSVRRQFLRVMCNHCDSPPCVEICPTGATWKRADGIVDQDGDICIGCKYCINACPYGSRYTDPKSHTTRKCDFCEHRIAQGVVPACVSTCNARALLFGDLNDPKSDVSQAVARNPVHVLRPEMATKPSVYYIGLDGSAYSPVKNRPSLQAL